MTVRDWLELLVVPLALVVISFLFTVQQDQRQQRTENQRAVAEQKLAEQQAQDEALQAYLDQMNQLMLERKLLEAEPGDPVHTLAQARTSTVILRLDAEHNESVTRFLINSGLAVRSKGGFRVEHLGFPLPGVPLGSETSARLLSRNALPHATLSGAHLLNADLSVADLTGADLTGADLTGANLKNAYLSDANLSGAFLYRADLSDAFLADANLPNADLRGADLSGAELNGANLRRTKGVTNEELEQQASTLEGATMPNGQKYEEWLKDKKASGKDE